LLPSKSCPIHHPRHSINRRCTAARKLTTKINITELFLCSPAVAVIGRQLLWHVCIACSLNNELQANIQTTVVSPAGTRDPSSPGREKHLNPSRCHGNCNRIHTLSPLVFCFLSSPPQIFRKYSYVIFQHSCNWVRFSGGSKRYSGALQNIQDGGESRQTSYPMGLFPRG
jgi:hypothetical protein